VGIDVLRKLTCSLAHHVEWFFPTMADLLPNSKNVDVSLLLERLLDSVEDMLATMQQQNEMAELHRQSFQLYMEANKNVNKAIKSS